MVPRNALERTRVFPALGSNKVGGRSNLMDRLLEQKVRAGESWPDNIRMEPVMKKEAFKRVQTGVRSRLKRLLRET